MISPEFIERSELLLDFDLYFIIYVVQNEDERTTLLGRIKELLQGKGLGCIELNLETASVNDIRGLVIIHQSSSGDPESYEFGAPSWWQEKPFGILISGLQNLTEENNGLTKLTKLLAYLPSVGPFQYAGEERNLPKGSAMRAKIPESDFPRCREVILTQPRRYIEAVMPKKVRRDEAGTWRRIDQ